MFKKQEAKTPTNVLCHDMLHTTYYILLFQLSRSAQKWADHLAEIDRYDHHSTFGENIAKNRGFPVGIFKAQM